MNPLSPSLDRKGLDLWVHVAQMSQLAYRSGDLWATSMREAGWSSFGFLDPGAGYQGGWAWSEDFKLLEITCRGSSELRDFTLDATSWIPNRWSELPAGWWVGYGMVKGPRRAWPDILRLFDRFNPRLVMWGGHSKGGGEAVVSHAATMMLSIESACTAIEPPRVFFRRTRNAYRVELDRWALPSVVVINTRHGHVDSVPSHPALLKHGPDLAVLGRHKVHQGADALKRWREHQGADRKPWVPWRRIRAHGIEGVLEHMKALRGPPAEW